MTVWQTHCKNKHMTRVEIHGETRRRTPMTDQARERSEALRRGAGDYLQQRRDIVGLSLIASAAMGLITLYQMGIIRHLPEPPLRRLDADEIDAAPEAYALLRTPDAALGLASYAATTVLGAMGGRGRAETQPWLPLVLAAKVALDALVAGKLTVDQWTKHRAFCLWCLVAAAATFASIPQVLPEARDERRRLRRTHA